MKKTELLRMAQRMILEAQGAGDLRLEILHCLYELEQSERLLEEMEEKK